MAICKNCGKGLIIRNGKCVYCGAVPDGDCANNSGQYNGYSQRKRQRYDSKDNKPNLIYQIFLVFMVLAIIIPISFAEYETKNGSWWGIATMYGVNGSIVLWSVITMVYAVRGHFSSRIPDVASGGEMVVGNGDCVTFGTDWYRTVDYLLLRTLLLLFSPNELHCDTRSDADTLSFVGGAASAVACVCLI